MELTHNYTSENRFNDYLPDRQLVSVQEIRRKTPQADKCPSGLVTSIVRFTEFFKRNSFSDGTWTAVDLIIWTQVEPGVYLISACMMTFRPLLDRVGHKDFFGRRKPNSGKTFDSEDTDRNNIALKPRLGPDAHGFHRLNNDWEHDSGIRVTTNIHVGGGTTGTGEGFPAEP